MLIVTEYAALRLTQNTKYFSIPKTILGMFDMRSQSRAL